MAELTPRPAQAPRLPCSVLAPGTRNRHTDVWLSWAEFIARESNLKCVSSGVLAVALEAAGLLEEAGLTIPATRPYWYLAFMEAAAKRETEHRPSNAVGPMLSQDLPAEVLACLVEARPVLACIRAFRAAQDPVWAGLFWTESSQEDAHSSRVRLQGAAALANLVEQKLLTSLVGQTAAVEALRKLAFQVGLREKAVGPPPAALFLGPPGVGKSMAGESFAEALAEWHGDEEASVIRLDMTQFVEWSAGRDLWGQAGRAGSLLTRIEEHPRSILLIEEFEKAHAKVLESFLPVLGTGRYERDGKAIDFSEAVFVFTSNLGAELWGRRGGGPTAFTVDPLDLIPLHGNGKDRSEWSKTAIPRELLSRLAQGHVVLFRAHQGHHHLDLIHRLSQRTEG